MLVIEALAEHPAFSSLTVLRVPRGEEYAANAIRVNDRVLLPAGYPGVEELLRNAGDTLLTLCPWWDGPAGRAALQAQLARDAARRPARWIWVYHWPPAGSPTCWTGRRHYGDAESAFTRVIEEMNPQNTRALRGMYELALAKGRMVQEQLTEGRVFLE